MKLKGQWAWMILVCIILLQGCMTDRSGQGAEQEPKKQLVSFLHYFSGTLKGGIDEMVTDFNASKPEYQLKATPLDHEAFKVNILESLRQGNTPDLFSYWSGARVESIIKTLQPIDEIWDAENMDSFFDRALVNSACTYDGHKYLIPITQHYVTVFYNKKVFDQLGLEPPQTWDAFLQTCETLKNNNVTPIALGSKSKWPAQFWFDYLLLRTAPYQYRADLMSGKASYTDSEVMNVFKLWNQLMQKGYFNENANDLEWDKEAMDTLAQGKAGMMLMGTWAIGILDSEPYNLKQQQDYDCFSFPIIDSNIPLCALGPVDGIILPKKAINAKGAEAAMAFFAREESQKVMSRGSGALAPNILVQESFYTPMQQKIRKEIHNSASWAFNYDLATPPETAEVGLELFAQFLEFPEQYEQLLQRTQPLMEEGFKKAGDVQ